MMILHYLKSKIHRATVTEANLHYEGSLTIGADLLDASRIRPFEKIAVFNIANGERFETYAIQGKAGTICLNGAAAWKGKVGDLVIIVSYCQLTEEEIQTFQPTIVTLKENNQIKGRIGP